MSQHSTGCYVADTHISKCMHSGFATISSKRNRKGRRHDIEDTYGDTKRTRASHYVGRTQGSSGDKESQRKESLSTKEVIPNHLLLCWLGAGLHKQWWGLTSAWRLSSRTMCWLVDDFFSLKSSWRTWTCIESCFSTSDACKESSIMMLSREATGFSSDSINLS